MPAFMAKGFIDNVRALGRSLATAGEFDHEVLRRFAGTENLTGLRLWFVGTIGDRMARAFFWHRVMKNNKAFERRLAQPYSDPPEGW